MGSCSLTTRDGSFGSAASGSGGGMSCSLTTRDGSFGSAASGSGGGMVGVGPGAQLPLPSFQACYQRGR
ncbi:hypothetical protein PLESTB_000707600 [Pleodorina starrii]|uniref:Uncharacterized protein n=1 Tax=Pleodorina starrii TaxID=330485 RepID=A0A9W6F1S9_9CHLO|nr:hypothetical protein PLESTB_000052100 [Pleodorina starrii]GLC53099.1 hypothetical protein PLESTB_000707600 [Pleodorina starrii]